MHLVTIHGIGDQMYDYAEPFAEMVKKYAEEEVCLHPIYWADLSRYVGFTEWGSKLDYAFDVLKYAFKRKARKKIKFRVREALYPLSAEKAEDTLLVTHSWGGVIAWNMLPHDSVNLWVSFNTRRYLSTRFNKPPRVREHVNYWSDNDKLSAPINYRGRRVMNINRPKWGHGPMWDNDERARLVGMFWRTRPERRLR